MLSLNVSKYLQAYRNSGGCVRARLLAVVTAIASKWGESTSELWAHLNAATRRRVGGLVN